MSTGGIPLLSSLCGLDGRLFSSEDEAVYCANSNYTYRGAFTLAFTIVLVITVLFVSKAAEVNASYSTPILVSAAVIGLALGWVWSANSSFGPVSQFKTDDAAVKDAITKYGFTIDKARLFVQEKRSEQQNFINQNTRNNSWPSRGNTSSVNLGNFRLGF